MVALSWGWDSYGMKLIEKPHNDQCWQGWPIRLYKACQSLKIMSFDKEYQSLRKYGLFLIDEGHNFTYKLKDLTHIFK